MSRLDRSPDAHTLFKPGTVYAIQDGSTRAIKIGYTSRTVARRLKELQTGNPIKPKIVWKGPGTIVDEMAIHHLLRPSRATGEWFHPTDIVRIAVGMMRAYGAPFVAGLELNMLQTFVPVVGGWVPHFFKSKNDWGPRGYFPTWSFRPPDVPHIG